MCVKYCWTLILFCYIYHLIIIIKFFTDEGKISGWSSLFFTSIQLGPLFSCLLFWSWFILAFYQILVLYFLQKKNELSFSLVHVRLAEELINSPIVTHLLVSYPKKCLDLVISSWEFLGKKLYSCCCCDRSVCRTRPNSYVILFAILLWVIYFHHLSNIVSLTEV